MVFNKLYFEKKILYKDKDLNEDRPYIDFIIDDSPLKDHLEHSESDITPFGWGNNIHLELNSANRLITFKKSELSNGFQTAYVCARCGDEECGAVLFNIVTHGAYVEWNQFVHSDGYPSKTDPDELIDIPSFFFEMGGYQKAIGQLMKMIRGKSKN